MSLSTIGKVTYYAIRIEFQVRGLHVHSFTWIFMDFFYKKKKKSFIWIKNPPKLSEEILGTYIEFIDNTIHANLPAPDDDLSFMSYKPKSNTYTLKKL